MSNGTYKFLNFIKLKNYIFLKTNLIIIIIIYFIKIVGLKGYIIWLN